MLRADRRSFLASLAAGAATLWVCATRRFAPVTTTLTAAKDPRSTVIKIKERWRRDSEDRIWRNGELTAYNDFPFVYLRVDRERWPWAVKQ